jgi:hypothetical protein
MIRSTLAVAVLVGLVPADARSQEVALEAGQRIQLALERAESAGIPRTLLENRLAEGRAKGVSEERISAVMEARLETLLRARSLIGERDGALDPTELAAAGAALEAGVSAEALAALRGRAPAEQRTVAITVLTELVQRGLASEIALERVQLALSRRGGDPRDITRRPTEPRDRERTFRPSSGSRPDGRDTPPGGSRGTGIGVDVGVGVDTRIGDGIERGTRTAGERASQTGGDRGNQTGGR